MMSLIYTVIFLGMVLVPIIPLLIGKYVSRPWEVSTFPTMVFITLVGKFIINIMLSAYIYYSIDSSTNIFENYSDSLNEIIALSVLYFIVFIFINSTVSNIRYKVSNFFLNKLPEITEKWKEDNNIHTIITMIGSFDRLSIMIKFDMLLNLIFAIVLFDMFSLWTGYCFILLINTMLISIAIRTMLENIENKIK